MNTARNEKQDEGSLASRTRSQAAIEVDCSDWESDIPESQWATGKLVSVSRVLPGTDLVIESDNKQPAR